MARTGASLGKIFNPWYFKSSEVDIFHEKDASSRRVLGADSHFYRRQLEGFADTILKGAPMRGANVEDGLASVQAMVCDRALCRIGRTDRTGDRRGRRVMYPAIFSRVYPMQNVAEGPRGRLHRWVSRDSGRHLASAGLASLPGSLPPGIALPIRFGVACQRHSRSRRFSGTYNMAHPDANVRKASRVGFPERCDGGARHGSTHRYSLHRFQGRTRYVEVPPRQSQ